MTTHDPSTGCLVHSSLDESLHLVRSALESGSAAVPSGDLAELGGKLAELRGSLAALQSSATADVAALEELVQDFLALPRLSRANLEVVHRALVRVRDLVDTPQPLAEAVHESPSGILPNDSPQHDVDPEILEIFVVESGDHLESAEAHLLALEGGDLDAEHVRALFRVFHTLKGSAAVTGASSILEVCHEIENLLDVARGEPSILDEARITALLEMVDHLRAVVARLPSEHTLLTQAPPELPDAARRLHTAIVSGAPTPAAPLASAPHPSLPGRNGDLLRVPATRLDALVDSIGELVIAESAVRRAILDETGTDSRSFRTLTRLKQISRELQDMATTLRMVPARATFSRAARAARDAARIVGKDVEFRTAGEDTLLDKAMLDTLVDPLIHLVRNAVDHGIEAVEERVAQGKRERGSVWIHAHQESGGIRIEVGDDGGGFDRAAILRRAQHAGILAPDCPLPADVDNLVFEPGLSTSQEVDELSGRGVGMDIVRKTIEGMRGSISVHSEAGQGTVYVIRLPLTLAIIDGLLVRVGDERYIAPILAVKRSVQPRPEAITELPDGTTVLRSEGELLPVLQLGQRFGIRPDAADPTEGIVLLVESRGAVVGILVDQVIGQQEIVIKSMDAGVVGSSGIGGAAILSDGSVGLILDVDALVHAEVSAAPRAS